MKKMLPVEIWTIIQTEEGNAVLLRPLEKSLILPVFVGQIEVQSILIGKDNLIMPRPLTHDLFIKLIDSENLILDRVEIHDLKDNVFYARLIITGEKYTEKPLILDSRPSDALGLAARKKCPIMVSAEIIKKTGIPLDIFIDIFTSRDESDTAGRKSSMLDDKKTSLMKQLNSAVEKEEYEKAAELRDMLKEIGD